MSLWGNRKSRIVTTLLALLLAAPGTVFANAGKILFARGEVAITSQAGERRQAETGDAVDEGDRVTTGARSMAQLRLSDGALVSLRSHSDYQIVAQKDEGDLLEQAGKLFSGWMRTVTGAIGEKDPEAVRQETPVATIGIRGTTYQVIHIPEGGHPDFPDAPPGTYIYLQEGAIEISGDGEVRYMEPGDVVFVPLDGGAPMPAPEWRRLFSEEDGGPGGEGAEEDTQGGEDRTGRDDLESNDALNDGVEETLGEEDGAGAGPGTLGAAGARGVYNPSFPQSLEASGGNLTVLSDESGDYVQSMQWADSDGLVHDLQATEEEPDSRGSASLANGQRVIWGVWAEGNYSATFNGSPQSVTGDWHYAAGSNVLTENEAVNLPLTGQYGYDYVGGTTLTGSEGGSMTITGGGLLVDFTNNGLQVSIDATANAMSDTYTGNGNFTSFYDTDGAGIFLGGQTNTGWGGSIRGSFVGPNAEGVISDVRLDQGSTEEFYGAAVFENNGPQ